MKNRSVPTDCVLPHLFYREVAAAVDWLTRVFGFEERFRYGNPEHPSGAQLQLGEACIMVHGACPNNKSPADVGSCTQNLTLFVGDVDAHYATARGQGAIILEELRSTEYGERLYSVEDLDGHRWEFAQHIGDISPEEWGATVTIRLPQHPE